MASKVNIFAIIVLFISVALLVFLAVSAYYFWNTMKLTPPTQSVSTFMFWIALLMVIVVLGLIIYAIIAIFTHKTFVEKQTTEETDVGPTIPQTTEEESDITRGARGVAINRELEGLSSFFSN